MESKKDPALHSKQDPTRGACAASRKGILPSPATEPLKCGLIDKTYIVRCKGLLPRAVIAASFKFGEEQLLLMDSDGNIAALFSVDRVESWSVLPH